MPGYGYSEMSKKEQIESGKFIEEYLVKGKNLRLIVFLLDIRHKPTEDDKLMYEFILKENLPFIIVTNKADKIAVTKVSDEVNKIKEFFGISYSTVIPFSSERKIYTEDTWKEIEKFIS